MFSIGLAIVMFTAVVLLLVALLMVARKKMVASGDVAITVNEDSTKVMKVAAGGTLLGALTDHKIFIPSACGGKGTCGVCEVIVKEGGGAILPTETGFISRKEAKHGCRLACQVKVKRDMRIEVPAEIFSVRKWDCKVLSNRNVSTFIKELIVELPPGEDVPFRAGGYVQISCPPHQLAYKDFDIETHFREEWDKFDLWRFKSVVTEPVERGYSLASYPLEKGLLMFTIRIVFPPNYDDKIPPGKMSSFLFNLKLGDHVTVAGPFGEFFARDTDKEMCFVAAGAGMAPMRSHIYDQLLRLKSTRKMSFWYSARNLSEVFYVDEFNKLAAEHPNFKWHIVLSEPRPEDNWTGPVGLVRHKALHHLFLANHPAPEDVEYYLCGPDVMNKAVIRMCMDVGVDRENIMLDDFGL